jgi:hypothetical protein
MRSLLSTLKEQDPGYFRAVAEQWGIDLPGRASADPAAYLAQSMLEAENLREYIGELPESVRKLIALLSLNKGRMLFAELEREFGTIREMGPGKRDREKPWRAPVSPLEDLWYRGLIGRAFADTAHGPREFVYLPHDIQHLIPAQGSGPDMVCGKLAEDPSVENIASTVILEDATLIIAALRKCAWDRPLEALGEAHGLTESLLFPAALTLASAILHEIGILRSQPFTPDRERATLFLETDRTDALNSLVLGWRDSRAWNDLRAAPGVHNSTEDWPNDPVMSRAGILACMRAVPIGQWWSIDRFVRDIREFSPDFQRPGGDFNSWYLQDGAGQFLRGYDKWDDVEGALIRYVIRGPLFWLGAVDLGRAGLELPPIAFRRTGFSAVLFGEHGSIPDTPAAPIRIQADGMVTLPLFASRMHHFQIARMTDWESRSKDRYVYRISPRSLMNARGQGLKLAHVIAILQAASEEDLPPSIKTAIERWFREGTEATLEEMFVLNVSDAAIIDLMQSHTETSRYLGERISPETIEVRKANWPRLRDAAARLGLFIHAPE